MSLSSAAMRNSFLMVLDAKLVADEQSKLQKGAIAKNVALGDSSDCVMRINGPNDVDDSRNFGTNRCVKVLMVRQSCLNGFTVDELSHVRHATVIHRSAFRPRILMFLQSEKPMSTTFRVLRSAWRTLNGSDGAVT